MQNLLSKDVLYPSLKEITAKVCTCLCLIPQLHLQVPLMRMRFTPLVPWVVERQQAKPPSRGLPALWAAGQNHGWHLWAVREGGAELWREGKRLWRHHGTDAEGTQVNWVSLFESYLPTTSVNDVVAPCTSVIFVFPLRVICPAAAGTWPTTERAGRWCGKCPLLTLCSRRLMWSLGMYVCLSVNICVFFFYV